MEHLKYKKLLNSKKEFKSAVDFIYGMVSKGIPLSAIDTNDWNSSPSTIVYLTIPYGSKKKGGKHKAWRNRFGESTLKSAVTFWKTKG